MWSLCSAHLALVFDAFNPSLLALGRRQHGGFASREKSWWGPSEEKKFESKIQNVKSGNSPQRALFIFQKQNHKIQKGVRLWVRHECVSRV